MLVSVIDMSNKNVDLNKHLIFEFYLKTTTSLVTSSNLFKYEKCYFKRIHKS